MSQYKHITESTQLKVGFGKIKSLFISSATTTPRVSIYDSATSNTADPELIHQFTPTSASVRQLSGDIGGIAFNKGLYVVISGDVSMTVINE